MDGIKVVDEIIDVNSSPLHPLVIGYLCLILYCGSCLTFNYYWFLLYLQVSLYLEEVEATEMRLAHSNNEVGCHYRQSLQDIRIKAQSGSLTSEEFKAQRDVFINEFALIQEYYDDLSSFSDDDEIVTKQSFCDRLFSGFCVRRVRKEKVS